MTTDTTSPAVRELAASIVGKIHWHFQHWAPLFYPEKATDIVEHMLQPLSTANEALQAQVEELKAHMEITDHESLEIEDWLIGNAEIDLKTGLIDRQKKIKERIRDLIATEGQVGDLTAERDKLKADLQAAEGLVSGLSEIIYYKAGASGKEVYMEAQQWLARAEMKGNVSP